MQPGPQSSPASRNIQRQGRAAHTVIPWPGQEPPGVLNRGKFSRSGDAGEEATHDEKREDAAGHKSSSCL